MRPNLAMQTKQLKWRFDDKTIELGCDWSGQGPKILFLPALSSISTRREMHPLQKLLSANYQTVVADWPGFGDQPRPSHDWQPVTYASFLTYLIDALTPLHAVIAAGHAATFALAHACAHPHGFGRLVLVAPTWRGPLPTMMNGNRLWFDRICRMVDLPIVGPLLYRLNVNPLVIRHMAAGHVYTDRLWLRGERELSFLTWRGGHLFRCSWYTARKHRRARVQRWRHSRPSPGCTLYLCRSVSFQCTRNSRN
jgi:pimeloyl-ACP methyl ester carboxylesterase